MVSLLLDGRSNPRVEEEALAAARGAAATVAAASASAEACGPANSRSHVRFSSVCECFGV